MSYEDDFIVSSSSSSNQNVPMIIEKVNKGTFDLDAYIQNYSGHTRILRLLFIAEHCPDLEQEALRQALVELKRTANTSIYKEYSEKAATKFGSQYRPDLSWIDSVEKKSQQQLERLELDLNNHKTNMVKEAIRQGHADLGEFHYNRGDLNSALKCYIRERDYCTSSKHIIAMSLAVIKVALEVPNYSHVSNYVAKAEQTSDSNEPSLVAKLSVASGLVLLENKKYKMAAQKFLATPFELSGANSWPEVIAPQDVAIYGALTALATYDRQELKKRVIDNPQFKNFLELTPEVRELLNDFYESRYASMLRYLDRIKTDVLLDIHLWDHVANLYEKIRSKAIIQYFTPFSSVDLTTMATAFNTTVPLLEKELAKLITDGSISARIDSHNKRLFARQTDQRSTTFQNAIRIGEEYQSNTLALLQRVTLMKSDFVVKAPRREDKDK